MPSIKDADRYYVGAVIGERTVVDKPERIADSKGRMHWKVRMKCKCGDTSMVAVSTLRKGHGTCYSCSAAGGRKHGMATTPTYKSWAAMMNRCYRDKTNDFHLYGGRGIKVCDRWMDFESFYADMGDRPDGQTIDRISSDGNYEPSNCRWAKIYDYFREPEHIKFWEEKIKSHYEGGEIIEVQKIDGIA